MTVPDRDRLARLAEAATPGPWIASDACVHQLPEHLAQPALAECERHIDAEFIAACSPDVVLALLGEITRLEGALKHEHDLGLASELYDALGRAERAEAERDKLRLGIEQADALRAALAPFVAEET